MHKLLDKYLPRFVTDEVALIHGDEDFEILCHVDDLLNGEHYDATCLISSFNLFSIAIFPRFICFVETNPGVKGVDK